MDETKNVHDEIEERWRSVFSPLIPDRDENMFSGIKEMETKEAGFVDPDAKPSPYSDAYVGLELIKMSLHGSGSMGVDDPRAKDLYKMGTELIRTVTLRLSLGE